jgi:hypothetical protein
MTPEEWDGEIAEQLLRDAEAVEKEAGFFQGTIDVRLAESWSWRQNVSWSEEARDALRKAGSTPGEDRTVTIKKDPESLAKRGRERR